MTRPGNSRLHFGFAIAVVGLVACDFSFIFSKTRLLAVCLQVIFAVATIVLLVRLQQRQHKTTQKLLKKISELGEEMKKEGEDYRARSFRGARRPLNPNGRN